MLAAILVARFSRRARTHVAALGTPPAPPRFGTARATSPEELSAATLAFSCGGLALIAELEGPEAVLVILGCALAVTLVGAAGTEQTAVLRAVR